MKTIIEKTLKTNWRSARDFDQNGLEKGWNTAIPENTIEPFVPGLIQDTYGDFYTGIAWYWNEFTVDKIPVDTDCFLKLGNTEGIADFWLNGTYLGRQILKDVYYEYACTHAVRPGKNLLAIRICVPGDEPFEGYTFQDIPAIFATPQSCSFGGIRYPVRIAFRPLVRTDRAVVRADIHTGKVEADLQLHNSLDTTQNIRISAKILSASGETVCQSALDKTLQPGESTDSLALLVEEPVLWNSKEPYLYTLQLDILQNGNSLHTHTVRFGFREFVVKDGWFTLNGKRMLMRSSYVMDGWHPQVALLTNEMLYKELVNLKALGFDSIRYHFSTGRPEILDMCDQLGILVIEAHGGSWILKKNNKDLKGMFHAHFERTVYEDINHPSIIAWEFVNEAHFEHDVAAAALPALRAIDMTRLVFLGSGRWDNDMRLGSIANPGSMDWECVWGAEDPHAEAPTEMVKAPLSHPDLGEWTWYDDDMCCWQPYLGDVHIYVRIPMTFRGKYALRYHAKGLKPAFISETGSNSFGDAISLTRRIEQEVRIPQDERTRNCFLCGEFIQEQWEHYELGDLYPFPEDLVLDGDRQNARTRTAQMELMRANPNVNGYCFSCLSGPYSAFGALNWFRERRPYVADAVMNCNAPLHWCVFVEPGHVYAGESFTVEAVLASEDVLRPGSYPVCARIQSIQTGRVWEYRTELNIEDPGDGYLPLAMPVFKEEVTLDVPGDYNLTVYLEKGGAPTGGRKTIFISEKPCGAGKKASCVGLEEKATQWLTAQGVELGDEGTILVGDMPDEDAAWDALYKRIEAGATAVFLKPEAFLLHEENPYEYDVRHEPKRLRIDNPGVLQFTDNWAYRVHTILKKHPYSSGMQLGLLNDDIYNQTEPIYVYKEIQKPDEIVAATISAPYVGKSDDEVHGWIAGVSMGAYNYGMGKIVLNTFRILDELGNNPAADKLLLNFL